MNTFPLKIISLKETLFNGDAVSVSVPANDGEITVLSGHIPLITNLKNGKIKVRGDKEKIFEIKKGFLEVNPQKVTILL